MDAFVFVKKEDLRIAPGRKLIKAAEYLEYVEARGVLAAARKRAEEILAEARKVYEAEKQKGFQAGLTEGKMAMSRQMMETATKTVNYFGSLETRLVDIVTSALKKILGEMDAQDLVLKVVQNSLNLARNQKQVILRVAPDQVGTVREHLDEIMADFPSISFIDVVSDSRLKSGGCILETDIGIVDAGIDTQIEAIRRSLTKSFQR